MFASLHGRSKPAGLVPLSWACHPGWRSAPRCRREAGAHAGSVIGELDAQIIRDRKSVV